MMNLADLQDFRAKLAAMQDEVRPISASAAHDLKPVELDQTRVGRVSRMDAMQLQQMSREAERRRRQLLVKIDGALRRIESGTLWAMLSVRDGDRPSPPGRRPDDYAMPRLR